MACIHNANASVLQLRKGKEVNTSSRNNGIIHGRNVPTYVIHMWIIPILKLMSISMCPNALELFLPQWITDFSEILVLDTETYFYSYRLYTEIDLMVKWSREILDFKMRITYNAKCIFVYTTYIWYVIFYMDIQIKFRQAQASNFFNLLT